MLSFPRSAQKKNALAALGSRRVSRVWFRCRAETNFSLALSSLCTPFLPSSPCQKSPRIRDDFANTQSARAQAGGQRAIPEYKFRQRNLAVTNESVIECDVRLWARDQFFGQ